MHYILSEEVSRERITRQSGYHLVSPMSKSAMTSKSSGAKHLCAVCLTGIFLVLEYLSSSVLCNKENKKTTLVMISNEITTNISDHT